MAYQILKHSHSGLRWLILLILVFAVVTAFYKYRKQKDFTTSSKKIALLGLIFTHTQLLIGFALFLISPKIVFSANSLSNKLIRFFLLEHTFLMLLAVILLTIGYSKLNYLTTDTAKHRRILLYYSIAFALVFLAIPWPWKGFAAGWY